MNEMELSLLGGALIGLAAAGLMFTTGKTAGVSGILEGLLRGEKSELDWKASFLLGLLAGGVGLLWFFPSAISETLGQSWPRLILAGLLVGFGSRQGGGCTSGHGVCGIGRLSRRSFVGTCVFIATGAATVLAMRALQGAF